MIHHLQALRIRVRAAVDALFGTNVGDEASRAYAQVAQAANREIEFLNSGAWREVEEHRAFLGSIDRLDKKQNHRSLWTK